MGEAKRRREAAVATLIQEGLPADRAVEAAVASTEPGGDKPKVALAYVHGDANRVTSFEESREALINHDRAHQGLLAHDNGRMSVRCGTDGLPAARNTVAARMVTSDVDWLLWLDTDMGVAPDTLYRLLAVADSRDRPVVGALCFAQRQFAHDGMSGYRTQPLPTIYDWVPGEDGVPRFTSVPLYPVNHVVQTPATGSACILIHRSVFEKIAGKFGPTWYDRTPGTDGRLLGEDISFCVRATALDIPIHVHTGVRTTHYKAQWLSEVDHWRNYNPPPATEPVAVIVPVMRRPNNAEPFMRSLRASTGLAEVYAMCDLDDTDTVAAWASAGANVVAATYGGRPGSFAQKVNAGYGKTAEPWLFLVGDDVRFRPGWLDHAQHVAETFGAKVVGTNDLANPRVMAGEHATHVLVARSYVDEVGASWDGPGVLAHEGYGHWFVDDELVTAAKQRGVWQMALGSVVEHLHPIFGKGEPDKVYELGQSHAAADRKTFKARLRANS